MDFEHTEVGEGAHNCLVACHINKCIYVCIYLHASVIMQKITLNTQYLDNYSNSSIN